MIYSLKWEIYVLAEEVLLSFKVRKFFKDGTCVVASEELNGVKKVFSANEVLNKSDDAVEIYLGKLEGNLGLVKTWLKKGWYYQFLLIF